MKDPADITREQHLADETKYLVCQLAKDLGLPICDVRWLDGNDEPEVYMAGGVWLPESAVRKMRESDE